MRKIVSYFMMLFGKINIKPRAVKTLNPKAILKNTSTLVITQSNAFHVYCQLHKEAPDTPIQFITKSAQLYEVELDETGSPRFPSTEILEKGGILVFDLKTLSPTERLSLNCLTEKPPSFTVEDPHTANHLRLIMPFHKDSKIVLVDSSLENHESDLTGRVSLHHVQKGERIIRQHEFTLQSEESYSDTEDIVTVDFALPNWKKDILGRNYPKHGDTLIHEGKLEQALRESKKLVLLNCPPQDPEVQRFLNLMAESGTVRVAGNKELSIKSLTIELCNGHPQLKGLQKREITPLQKQSIHPDFFPLTRENFQAMYPSIGADIKGKTHEYPGLSQMTSRPPVVVCSALSISQWVHLLESGLELFILKDVDIPKRISGLLDNSKNAPPSFNPPLPNIIGADVKIVRLHLSPLTSSENLLTQTIHENGGSRVRIKPMLQALRGGQTVILSGVSPELELALAPLLYGKPKILISGKIEALPGRLILQKAPKQDPYKDETWPDWAQTFKENLPKLLLRANSTNKAINEVLNESHLRLVEALAKRNGWVKAIFQGILEVVKLEEDLYFFLITALKRQLGSTKDVMQLETALCTLRLPPLHKQSFWQRMALADQTFLRDNKITDRHSLSEAEKEKYLYQLPSKMSTTPQTGSKSEEVSQDIIRNLPCCGVFTVLGGTGTGKSRLCTLLETEKSTLTSPFIEKPAIYRITMKPGMTQTDLLKHPTFKRYIKDKRPDHPKILIFDEFNFLPPSFYSFLDNYQPEQTNITVDGRRCKVSATHFFGKIGNPPETSAGRHDHPIQGTYPVFFTEPTLDEEKNAIKAQLSEIKTLSKEVINSLSYDILELFKTLQSKHPEHTFTMRDLEEICHRTIAYAQDSNPDELKTETLSKTAKQAVYDVMVSQLPEQTQAIYKRFYNLSLYIPRNFDDHYESLLKTANLHNIPLTRKMALDLYKSVLVFRERQCGILNTELSQTTGKSGFMFEGPPGIGKTVLARAVCQLFDLPFSELTAGYGKRLLVFRDEYEESKKKGGIILVNEHTTIKTEDFEGLCNDAVRDGVFLICTANPKGVFKKRERASLAQHARVTTCKLPSLTPPELVTIAKRELPNTPQVATQLVQYHLEIANQIKVMSQKPGLREFLNACQAIRNGSTPEQAFEAEYQAQVQLTGPLSLSARPEGLAPQRPKQLHVKELCLNYITLTLEQSPYPLKYTVQTGTVFECKKTYSTVDITLPNSLKWNRLKLEELHDICRYSLSIIRYQLNPNLSMPRTPICLQLTEPKPPAKPRTKAARASRAKPTLANDVQVKEVQAKETKQKAVDLQKDIPKDDPFEPAAAAPSAKKEKASITVDSRDTAAPLPSFSAQTKSGVTSERNNTEPFATINKKVNLVLSYTVGNTDGVKKVPGLLYTPIEVQVDILPTTAPCDLPIQYVGDVTFKWVEDTNLPKGLSEDRFLEDSETAIQLPPHEKEIAYKATFSKISGLSKEGYDFLKSHETEPRLLHFSPKFKQTHPKIVAAVTALIEDCKNGTFETHHQELFIKLLSYFPHSRHTTKQTEIAHRWQSYSDEQLEETSLLELCIEAGGGVCAEQTRIMRQAVQLCWPTIASLSEIGHKPKATGLQNLFIYQAGHAWPVFFTEDGTVHPLDPNMFITEKIATEGSSTVVDPTLEESESIFKFSNLLIETSALSDVRHPKSEHEPDTATATIGISAEPDFMIIEKEKAEWVKSTTSKTSYYTYTKMQVMPEKLTLAQQSWPQTGKDIQWNRLKDAILNNQRFTVPDALGQLKKLHEVKEYALRYQAQRHSASTKELSKLLTKGITLQFELFESLLQFKKAPLTIPKTKQSGIYTHEDFFMEDGARYDCVKLLEHGMATEDEFHYAMSNLIHDIWPGVPTLVELAIIVEIESDASLAKPNDRALMKTHVILPTETPLCLDTDKKPKHTCISIKGNVDHIDLKDYLVGLTDTVSPSGCTREFTVIDLERSSALSSDGYEEKLDIRCTCTGAQIPIQYNQERPVTLVEEQMELGEHTVLARDVHHTHLQIERLTPQVAKEIEGLDRTPATVDWEYCKRKNLLLKHTMDLMEGAPIEMALPLIAKAFMEGPNGVVKKGNIYSASKGEKGKWQALYEKRKTGGFLETMSDEIQQGSTLLGHHTAYIIAQIATSLWPGCFAYVRHNYISSGFSHHTVETVIETEDGIKFTLKGTLDKVDIGKMSHQYVRETSPELQEAFAECFPEFTKETVGTETVAHHSGQTQDYDRIVAQLNPNIDTTREENTKTILNLWVIDTTIPIPIQHWLNELGVLVMFIYKGELYPIEFKEALPYDQKARTKSEDFEDIEEKYPNACRVSQTELKKVVAKYVHLSTENLLPEPLLDIKDRPHLSTLDKDSLKLLLGKCLLFSGEILSERQFLEIKTKASTSYSSGYLLLDWLEKNKPRDFEVVEGNITIEKKGKTIQIHLASLPEPIKWYASCLNTNLPPQLQPKSLAAPIILMDRDLSTEMPVTHTWFEPSNLLETIDYSGFISGANSVELGSIVERVQVEHRIDFEGSNDTIPIRFGE